MAFVNYSTREINVKIVYYGPGLCGKTANLQYLYSRAPTQTRGRLISLATETERTLFFDFLPMNLGVLRGLKVRFHLYTVPGQVFYEASRKLILKGVDGLLFVADSDPLRLDANQESWEGLHRNLTDYGLSVPPLPVVIQYNKRDLPGALPVAELREALGNPDLPQFESVATDGTGVFESLKGLAKGVLNYLQNETLRSDRSGFAQPQPSEATTAPPVPPHPSVAAGPATEGMARSQPAVLAPGPRPSSTVPAADRASPARSEAIGPPPEKTSFPPVSAGSVQRPAAPRPSVVARSGAAGSPVGGDGRGATAPPPPGAKDSGPRPTAAPAAPPPSEDDSAPVKRRGFGWFRRSR